ncbi:hypothetical protein ACFWGP_05430 [Agromyces sp. NPDC127015]|uniref:hypothetical protein n=1 Tax=Agromyces sp. NPDC127015 TaxID=3347108 RepID=UPI00365BE442
MSERRNRSREACDLAEVLDGRYTPWWREVEVLETPRRIRIVADDPSGPDDDTTSEREVKPREVVETFDRIAKTRPSLLCCLADMTEEHLGMGCAEDADVIFQTLIYGRIVFG